MKTALFATAGALVVLALSASGARADNIRADEWAIPSLHAQDAWSITRGDGITVAVLDTGVAPAHPDLTGSVTTGSDFVADGAKLGDPYWGVHGTAMASAIAGHGHGVGSGDGMIGIAPGAKILSVRVIPESNDPLARHAFVGATDPIAQGIQYATDHGARVINMSLGGTGGSAGHQVAEMNAIQNAIAHGVVVVASAGNDGSTTNQTSYPAAYPGVISVAASDRNGHRATFSTREWATTVAAPGVGIVGASSGGTGYIIGDGTSPSAAFVSGLCALILAKYPQLSATQVRDVLEQSATAAGAYTQELGWGVIQPVAALKLAATLHPQPATPVPASPSARLLGNGILPQVGYGPAERLALRGLALLPVGGLLLVLAVLMATLRRRAR